MPLIGFLEAMFPQALPSVWFWVAAYVLAAIVYSILAYRYVESVDEKLDQLLEAAPKARTDFAKQEAAAEAIVPSETSPPLIDTATVAVTPGGPAEIHFRDLVDQRGSDSQVATLAKQAFDSLPTPQSLRQQTFDLVTVMRNCLKLIHGSLDADSFVAPELSNVFTTRLLAVKNKIQNFLHRDILRHDSRFPVTVKRMAMFLDDIERAANDLRDDIPPVP